MSDVFLKNPDGGFQFIDVSVVLSPTDTDIYLKRLLNELERSYRVVLAARQRAAKAGEAYETPKMELILSDACPEVGRGAGQVTKDYRDAWINNQIPVQYRAYKDAKDLLEQAIDYDWLVKNQIKVLQSLNNNAKVGYDAHRGGR